MSWSTINSQKLSSAIRPRQRRWTFKSQTLVLVHPLHLQKAKAKSEIEDQGSIGLLQENSWIGSWEIPPNSVATMLPIAWLFPTKRNRRRMTSTWPYMGFQTSWSQINTKMCIYLKAPKHQLLQPDIHPAARPAFWPSRAQAAASCLKVKAQVWF